MSFGAFFKSAMPGLQGIFAGYLQTEVKILSRTSAENEFSDDEDVFAAPVTVMGWVREMPESKLVQQGGAVQIPQTMRLHLPVEAVVERGDKVEANGGTWTVLDHNRENTYRVSTRVACERLG